MRGDAYMWWWSGGGGVVAVWVGGGVEKAGASGSVIFERKAHGCACRSEGEGEQGGGRWSGGWSAKDKSDR